MGLDHLFQKKKKKKIITVRKQTVQPRDDFETALIRVWNRQSLNYIVES
jgi:hypothetical protein